MRYPSNRDQFLVIPCWGCVLPRRSHMHCVRLTSSLVRQEVLISNPRCSSMGRGDVVRWEAMDAPPPGNQELKLDLWGLCILSPLHLSILPDLSVEFITYLISCHLVSIGLGLYACVHCVKFYAINMQRTHRTQCTKWACVKLYARTLVVLRTLRYAGNRPLQGKDAIDRQSSRPVCWAIIWYIT